tara:strand:- start:186 stop:362 length:177 start_codon:yes stop_codon:yes gene_type:complete
MLEERLKYLNQILKAILLFTLILLVREITTEGIYVHHSTLDIYHNNLDDLDEITIYNE